jgi:hypothetical protein
MYIIDNFHLGLDSQINHNLLGAYYLLNSRHNGLNWGSCKRENGKVLWISWSPLPIDLSTTKSPGGKKLYRSCPARVRT